MLDPARSKPPSPFFESPKGPAPPSRFLSNGRYRVLITSAGTGFSSCDALRLTTWRGDRVEDPEGFFLFLRDLDTGTVWTLGGHPGPADTPLGSASWQPGVFVLRGRKHDIEGRLEVCVPPEASLEIRRLTLSNHADRPRRIELTTCAEICLNEAAAHAAHPAFSKLFLQTEHVPGQRALLARRRPRGAGEHFPWLIHALLGPGDPRHETDRARFFGRGSRATRPLAFAAEARLTGATGNVLDPLFSLRWQVELGPGEEHRTAFLLGVAPEKGDALALAENHAEERAVTAAFSRAARHHRDLLAELGLGTQEAEYYQALAGAMLYGHPDLRASTEILHRLRGNLGDFSRHGLSAGNPWALVRADLPGGSACLDSMLQAHHYWQNLGLGISLVVLAEQASAEHARAVREPKEGLVVLVPADMTQDQCDLLETAAHLVITNGWPELAQRASAEPAGADREKRIAARPARDASPAAGGEQDGLEADSATELSFFNGLGGFTGDGREYVIHLQRQDDGTLKLPPRPWINCIASENFGFLVSENGAGYTWQGNSREHRLTPWFNDPLLDPHGEAFYLRDDTEGTFWSVLPGPVPGMAGYEMRHGLGYSMCRHRSSDLELQTILFAAERDPLRITRIRLTNRGRKTRRLSLFAYYQLVLGHAPEDSSRFVVSEQDPATGVLLARNRTAEAFADHVAFAAVVATDQARTMCVTADRAAFIGRGGHPGDPRALRLAAALDGHTGAGLDPCFAQQVVVELPPGATAEVAFLLGEAEDHEAVKAILARHATCESVAAALSRAQSFWREGLSAVQIQTPSPALDHLVNHWLPYQTLSCRIRGRSALYQSGGAFGYRDQLQDAAALVYLWPDLFRAQLLLHAAHQFQQGDVLHWWHPPLGRGLRTRFADDLLWLPYLTAFYIQTTGDRKILQETAPFLKTRLLADGEDEAFIQPETSVESADLYEHCCRALDRSLTCGAHGLPLFGTGDWNDGMNRVGREGRGESVWMGFFLHAILGDFTPLCEERGDEERVRRYRAYREDVRMALNEAGWDGQWYRRGYFDNGQPLGSAQNSECRIDALAQAWSVLSGAAPDERAAMAMQAVEDQLISTQDRLIRLLTPPFADTSNDPGYIKGYVPGVRENGGQYTHAALWVVRAMAMLGRNDRVAALLEMINPVHLARTPEDVARYQVEPYVVAADVYGAPPHVGRGGWTWYTGSSGWMLRVALESLLGLRVEAGRALCLQPCIPDDWPGFSLVYRLPGEETRYLIKAVNPDGAARQIVSATIDGATASIAGGICRVPVVHDGRAHRVELIMGAAAKEVP